MSKLTPEAEVARDRIMTQALRAVDGAFEKLAEPLKEDVRTFLAGVDDLTEEDKTEEAVGREAVNAVLTAMGAVFMAVVRRLTPVEAMMVVKVANEQSKRLMSRDEAEGQGLFGGNVVGKA